ncbi:hypothetical protein PH235_14390 [Trichococcus sp. K1Tr]|uniref:hypothetical protein n=1 Tax=Trichococcus sp. K1Tr TaxID=3020847 RepID=UPI0023305C67|nr:hypothetical protein [Trichococcus sp. K1Tr]MDB6354716.1 hypothetical protein [Trichococcus sp. K1Tr]
MKNEEAISYAVLAMKAAGFSQHQARTLFFDMRELMDELTEAEAVEQANAYLYAEQ